LLREELILLEKLNNLTSEQVILIHVKVNFT